MTSIQTVKEEYEDHLMRLPKAAGDGIGMKPGKEVILEGFDTTVEEIGVVTAQGE